MASPRRSRRWDLIALSLGAISATVSTVFSGWVVQWFQLFGDQPDRSDYLEAAGLFAGGAVWLAIACVVAWLARAPRWLRWFCGGSLALLVVLALGTRQSAADADPSASVLTHDPFDAGFSGAMTGMPWNWLVLVALVLALVQRRRVSAVPDAS